MNEKTSQTWAMVSKSVNRLSLAYQYDKGIDDSSYLKSDETLYRSTTHRLQGFLIELILLGLCRLYDSKESAGKKTNLSLKHLQLQLSKNKGTQRIADLIEKWRNEHQKQITDAQNIRNKYIAHLDRDHYEGRVELPDFNRNDVIALFKSTTELMTILSVEIANAGWSMAELVDPDGGTACMMRMLLRGEKYNKLMKDVRDKRIQNIEEVKSRINEDWGTSIR